MLKRLLPYLVCFSAALFLAYELIQLHMMNTIAVHMMKELNITATTFGYISSTYLLADVLFLLPAGMILDRFSVRKVILSAMGICVVGTALFASASSVTALCLAHFLSGIGNAFCFLSCMILVTRWFAPKMHATIMGSIVTIGMLGAFAAQSPFNLVAQNLGWREALKIDVILGLCILALIFFVVKENGEATKQSKSPALLLSIKNAIQNPITIKAGLYTGILNLPLMIISATFGNLFLTQIHHFSLDQAAFVTSMISMGTIFGSIAYGQLSDVFVDRKKLMVLGGVLSSIVMAMILTSPSSLAYLTLLFFLLGFITSSQVLGYPTIAQNSPEHLQGTSMGISAVIIMGLPMFIQPLTGFIMDRLWSSQLLFNGTRLYPYESFLYGFGMLPILFLIGAYLITTIASESKEKIAIQEA
jgi:MFS family permease